MKDIIEFDEGTETDRATEREGEAMKKTLTGQCIVVHTLL